MKAIKLSIYWPDDWKSVILTPKEWKIVQSGKSFSKEGEGYVYDGESFEDNWYFKGGVDGTVMVTYGDDGGVGFDGLFSELEIEEID